MTTAYDVSAVRADFPILQQDETLAFLDSTASSQKPRQVIETVDHYYRAYNANVHRGIYKLSEAATAAYEGARDKLKRFINAASRREIVFTSGTTASINLVAQTWGRATLKPGDVVISTVMEHHSNIVPWQLLAAERGFTLRYLPVTPEGLLDLHSLDLLLAEGHVKLVAVTHMSNVLGTINPVAEIARRAHAAGALILVDGAQSVPHSPVDVRALDVDFLAFSGHKMLGPTGTGVLYGKRHLLEAMPPWMGGGDMIARVTLDGSAWNDLPYKFEAGTPHIAGMIGLGAAVDYLSSIGLARIHAYESAITAYALDRLSEVPGVTVYGAAPESGGVTAFTLDGIHAHDLAQILDSDNVAVRAGHHCAMPLHEHLGVSATVRASYYLYSTHDEVDRLVGALHKALKVFGV